MVGNPSTLIDKKFQKVEKIERDSTYSKRRNK